MSARHARGLWWAKRDLRLADNDALALDECDTVLALYVAEPSLWRAPESSALHHHAWGQATAALGRSLAAREGRLCLRTGEVVDVLEKLHEEDGFDALYAHEETGTALTFARDEAVRAWARRRGVPFREVPQSGVIRGLVDRDERQPIIRERLLDTRVRAAPSRVPAWHPAGNDPEWPSWQALSGRAPPATLDPSRVQPVTEADGESTLAGFLGAASAAAAAQSRSCAAPISAG